MGERQFQPLKEFKFSGGIITDAPLTERPVLDLENLIPWPGGRDGLHPRQGMNVLTRLTAGLGVTHGTIAHLATLPERAQCELIALQEAGSGDVVMLTDTQDHYGRKTPLPDVGGPIPEGGDPDLPEYIDDDDDGDDPPAAKVDAPIIWTPTAAGNNQICLVFWSSTSNTCAYHRCQLSWSIPQTEDTGGEQEQPRVIRLSEHLLAVVGLETVDNYYYRVVCDLFDLTTMMAYGATHLHTPIASAVTERQDYPMQFSMDKVTADSEGNLYVVVYQGQWWIGNSGDDHIYIFRFACSDTACTFGGVASHKVGDTAEYNERAEQQASGVSDEGHLGIATVYTPEDENSNPLARQIKFFKVNPVTGADVASLDLATILENPAEIDRVSPCTPVCMPDGTWLVWYRLEAKSVLLRIAADLSAATVVLEVAESLRYDMMGYVGSSTAVYFDPYSPTVAYLLTGLDGTPATTELATGRLWGLPYSAIVERSVDAASNSVSRMNSDMLMVNGKVFDLTGNLVASVTLTDYYGTQATDAKVPTVGGGPYGMVIDPFCWYANNIAGAIA